VHVQIADRATRNPSELQMNPFRFGIGDGDDCTVDICQLDGRNDIACFDFSAGAAIAQATTSPTDRNANTSRNFFFMG
jgi:hypothetical protein